ncbi:MAG: hypothetical protein AABN34_22800 [Acidobacteriota bacterium]
MNSRRTYEALKAEVASLSIEEVRATPVWKKFRMVGELTSARQNSIKDKLRARYPQASAEDLRKRFGIVWLGSELAKQAFGWEVEEDDSDLMVA